MKILATILVSLFLVSCASKKHADGTTAVDATKKVPEKAMAKVAAGTLTCTKGSDVRTLEVVAEGGGCKLNYTKFGKASAPANSSNGTQYCYTVRDKIKGNLENSGHTCK